MTGRTYEAPGTRPSLSRGALLITLATALSRVTGFVRVVVVAAAMGTTFLANTYQTANTAPNLVFELVAAGVLTSVFVPTFVEHLARGRRAEGWQAADALASVGLVGLIGVATLVALLASPIMKMLTVGVDDPALRANEVALGARFLRFFAPQIVFYGLGMIMTAALHAHRRFALPAIAPIFNNVVVIVVYLLYASSQGDKAPTVDGISNGETILLGLGTTAGVVAMTVCLVPAVVKVGWKMRFRWQPRHPAVGKGLRLGMWALGYAGGYQAGLVVVLALANKVEGGVAAYQWAYTFFYLPHALFGVPIFSVLFTAMAERASADDTRGVAAQLRQGLALLAFILLPVAAGLVALAVPLSVVILDHGVMGRTDAVLVGNVLAMFALGLPGYSTFLVLTRAFYAVGDTRVPTVVNAVAVACASVTGAALFLFASERWRVPGLALGHTLGFTVGAALLGRRLRARLGPVGSRRLRAAIARAGVGSVLAVTAIVLVQRWLVDPGPPSSAAVIVPGVAGIGAYVAWALWTKSPELARVVALVRPLR